NANCALFFGYINSYANHVTPPRSEISNCSKPHLLPFSLVGYTGANPYLLKRMLIIRGLADSLCHGCKNPKNRMSGQLLPLIIRKKCNRQS
ncbi:hypothetical protein SAMN06296952_1136, partial [Oscillospiraceae bacterium]